MSNKVGVIINPIAGIGGSVGLKGSDGFDTLTKAIELGGKSLSYERTLQALKHVSGNFQHLEIVTYPSIMGEDVVREAGFNPIVIGEIDRSYTTEEDTLTGARELLNYGIDILVFAGGDGTARNIYTAINSQIPVIGIPAGVKIHSSVFAINPKSAGKLLFQYLSGKVTSLKESEVMDIDEKAFRDGNVNTKLYGYLMVPEEKILLQSVKSGGYSPLNEIRGIASEITESMKEDFLYVIGPGTTTKAITNKLGVEKTLLGVDILKNKQVIAKDVNERELWNYVKENDKKVKLIITVIGGQGHILGRGNQQLSPRILKEIGKENMIIIASKEKLLSIPSKRLLVDTGDPLLDEQLSGYIKVVTNYRENTICPVCS